jgi:hypothetical protein
MKGTLSMSFGEIKNYYYYHHSTNIIITVITGKFKEQFFFSSIAFHVAMTLNYLLHILTIRQNVFIIITYNLFFFLST